MKHSKKSSDLLDSDECSDLRGVTRIETMFETIVEMIE